MFTVSFQMNETLLLYTSQKLDGGGPSGWRVYKTQDIDTRQTYLATFFHYVDKTLNLGGITFPLEHI